MSRVRGTDIKFPQCVWSLDWQCVFHKIIWDREENHTHEIPEANFAPLVSGGHQQWADARVEGSGEDSLLHHFGHVLLRQLQVLQSWAVTCEGGDNTNLVVLLCSRQHQENDEPTKVERRVWNGPIGKMNGTLTLSEASRSSSLWSPGKRWEWGWKMKAERAEPELIHPPGQRGIFPQCKYLHRLINCTCTTLVWQCETFFLKTH